MLPAIQLTMAIQAMPALQDESACDAVWRDFQRGPELYDQLWGAMVSDGPPPAGNDDMFVVRASFP